MRRVFSMVCIIALALCLCAPAGAADSEYLLPDGLKTVAASADKLGLPEGLPEHAHVVSYSVENGLIHIQDRFDTHYEAWSDIWEYGPGTPGMPPNGSND